MVRGKTIAMTAGLTVGVLVLTGAYTLRRPLQVSWWLWRLESSELGTRREAGEALRQLRSPRAVPALVEAEVRERPREAGGAEPSVFLRAILETGSEALRPLLLEYRKRQGRTEELLHSLIHAVESDRTSVEDWVWLLSQDDLAELHDLALLSLGAVGPDAGSAVSKLLELVKAKEELTRFRVVETLRKIHPDPGGVLPALTALLEDPFPEVRAEAAFTLGCYGRRADGAAGKIQDLSADLDPTVARAAIWALERISPSGGTP